MYSQAFLDVLKEELAILQAKHPTLAEHLGRANGVLIEGRLFPHDDGETATVWGSDQKTSYSVNGICTCPDDQHSASPCKHRYALRLYHRVSERLVEPQTDTAAIEDAKKSIPPQYIQMVHGKPFVRYVGLLAMAHEQGLAKLEAGYVSVTDTLAVAWAIATFKDGRVFADGGDSTPENVHFGVRPHFARLALTRAKARALRDGLNVGVCSVEEIE